MYNYGAGVSMGPQRVGGVEGGGRLLEFCLRNEGRISGPQHIPYQDQKISVL